MKHEEKRSYGKNQQRSCEHFGHNFMQKSRNNCVSALCIVALQKNLLHFFAIYNRV